MQGWSSQTEVANKQNWQTQCSLKQNKLSRCQEKLLVQTLETIATCSFFQDQLSSARARAYHLAAPTPANVFQGHFAQYLSDPKALPTVKRSRFDIYSNVETQTKLCIRSLLVHLFRFWSIQHGWLAENRKQAYGKIKVGPQWRVGNLLDFFELAEDFEIYFQCLPVFHWFVEEDCEISVAEAGFEPWICGQGLHLSSLHQHPHASRVRSFGSQYFAFFHEGCGGFDAFFCHTAFPESPEGKLPCLLLTTVFIASPSSLACSWLSLLTIADACLSSFQVSSIPVTK